MKQLRRALGPMIAVWLLCQVGSAATIWIPVFDDCTCPHGDGAVCPMHHGASSRGPEKKSCSMRGADDSSAVMLASLLAPAAPLSSSAAPAPIPTDVRSVVADPSADGLRPVPPDPPPPRA